jgi:hypothetical protein
MGRIHSGANKVIAWFGVGPLELVDAVRGLRAVHLHIWFFHGQVLHIVGKLMPTCCEAEYWTRAWIIQESLLGKEV